jgi:hypothetical protein
MPNPLYGREFDKTPIAKKLQKNWTNGLGCDRMGLEDWTDE